MSDDDAYDLGVALCTARTLLKSLADRPDERPDPAWVAAVLKGIDAVITRIPLPAVEPRS